MTGDPRGVSYSNTQFRRKEPELPDITINLSLSRKNAIDLAQRLARNDDFREEVAANPLEVLGRNGIEITGADASRFAPMLPPKHVFEEALVNVREASQFASDGVESAESYAFWLFVVFAAT